MFSSSVFFFLQCPFSRRVAQFAKHGQVSDILGHLVQVRVASSAVPLPDEGPLFMHATTSYCIILQVLSKHSDVHTAERKQLSNLAFVCFVQQVIRVPFDGIAILPFHFSHPTWTRVISGRNFKFLSEEETNSPSFSCELAWAIRPTTLDCPCMATHRS